MNLQALTIYIIAQKKEREREIDRYVRTIADAQEEYVFALVLITARARVYITPKKKETARCI